MIEMIPEILRYSIGLALAIGLVRLPVIDPAYRPFILLLAVTGIHAVLSGVLSGDNYWNTVHLNVYDLVVFLLIYWLFRNLGIFGQSKYAEKLLLFPLTGFWYAENVVVHSIHEPNIWFTIISSLCIVLMSVHWVATLLVNEKSKLIWNPRFVISVAFVIFFSYKLMTDLFWLNGLGSSEEFKRLIDQIMLFVNFITNLIYAFAFLCIPRKQTALLRS
jgi:hypothetical protein